MPYILGISAFYHDSAAALIKNGEIITAVQEERFSRKKHDPDFPSKSIQFILTENNINLDDIKYVCFYEKPLLKFERILETYIATAPRGFSSFRKSIPIWAKEKLFQKYEILNGLRKISKKFPLKKIIFSEHHLSHAASCFYPSPFKEALILTVDGVGEWPTTSISIGNNEQIELMEELQFPHSLGLLYSAFTYYLGFEVNDGEYKVMGLAPYGSPIYKDLILDKLIDLKNDGSFKLNIQYFDFLTGLTMVNEKFFKLFGNNRRQADKEEIQQFHMDVAASIQQVLETIIIKILAYASAKFNLKNLCLAGGVALNCVANSKILKSQLFESVWIQPAAGDAGGSIGAALLCWHSKLGKKRKVSKNDKMKSSLLGPQFSDISIIQELNCHGQKHSILDETEIIRFAASKLSEGKAVGWFQGKMEFGPRALGNRSILADPRALNMQRSLNLKIKFRESFRPFAPAILVEDLKLWFEVENIDPYMVFVNHLRKERRKKFSSEVNGIKMLDIVRSDVPAVTHVDFSARVQTISKLQNPKFYKLISEFKKITGCPMLVNTSFNVNGEPIVCTPLDALKCFHSTNLDYLILGNVLIEK